MKPKLRFKEFTDEWKEKKLGDIAEINPKNNRDIPLLFEYIDLESVEKGKLIKKEIISKEVAPSRAKRIVKKFDILYQTVRPYQRNNFIELRNKDDVIASTGYALIRLKKDNPLFFYQQLNTDIFTNKVLVRCTGTSYPAINSLDLKYIKIQFPSLEEQEKIGKFFCLLDQRIEKQERKVELLEEEKKGYMQKLFKQELRFKDEQGNDYPAWEEKKLGEVAGYRRGSFPQPYTNKDYYDEVNGMPFVQVVDVKSNMRLSDNTKQHISSKAENKSVFIPKNSIIITIQGSIGRVAITQYDAYMDRTLLVFQNFLYPINKQYFAYEIKRVFDIEKQKAPGGTIKTITKAVLSNFIVNVPSLEEQEKIGNFLSLLDERIEKEQEKLRLMREEKKGYMERMFV